MIDDGDAGADMGDHKMMLMADPPLHTRMRRMVSRDFTPAASRALRPRIEELAVRIVDEVIERGECDLVEDIAGEMPSFVIAELLGIPLDDGRELYRLTETLHAASASVASRPSRRPSGRCSATPSRSTPPSARRRPMTWPASWRRVSSRADRWTRWTSSCGSCSWWTPAATPPGTWSVVASTPCSSTPTSSPPSAPDVDGLLPSAIEELLRYVSPVVHMRRRATRDTELRGTAIAEGDRVVMYYGAANRDPAVFDRPHELDLRRSPNHHVSFGGGGPHFCMGAHIARIEVDALLRQVLARLDDLAPAGEPQWLASNFISGPTHLPVTFRPGPRLGSPA